MQKYEDGLWGGVGAIRAREHQKINPSSWTRFTKTLQLDVKYPGINGIGVIYPVNEDEISSFLKLQRLERPNFKIHPKHNRDQYLPITYIEPIDINRQAVGLDMAHENNRYFSAIRSRGTGTPQITGPITLVQDNSKTPGFLFYVPFYKGEKPQDIVERRQSFAGLVYAPFIVKKLMDGFLSREDRQVGFSIRDNQETIYNEHLLEYPDFDPDPIFTKQLSINMYGRKWGFDIRSANSFRENASFSQSNFILFGGIVIDIFLLILFLLISRANRRAVSYASRMTFHLKHRTEELEKANSAKSEFISGMSHELRTPLNSIMGYSELIIEDAIELKNKDNELYGRNIFDSGKHLLDLISDILDISLVEAGRLEIKAVKVNLEDFLRQISSLGKILSAKKNNTFTIYNDLSINELIIDPVRIKQILTNIIGNSSKFTDNGNITLRFSHGESNGLKIQISDTGKGMETIDIKRIFEKFVQVHDTSKDSVAGTGLGLALTKNLVDLMGGEIIVSSELAKGTSFSIYIPNVFGAILKKAG
ncbi:MAG: CHASE domain-containing protein [Oligoflexales bacterium]